MAQAKAYGVGMTVTGVVLGGGFVVGLLATGHWAGGLAGSALAAWLYDRLTG